MTQCCKTLIERFYGHPRVYLAIFSTLLYAGALSPNDADADLKLYPYSSNIDSAYPGIEMKHQAGATDDFNLLEGDVRWPDEGPPGMGGGSSQYFYPFTFIGGYELQTDVRGNEAPFAPYEVQIRARDNDGSGFQLSDFRLAFHNYELMHELSDWVYEWVVPATFTSTGAEHRETGSISELPWNEEFEGYALSQASVNTVTLNDGDVFSTVIITPVIETHTGRNVPILWYIQHSLYPGEGESWDDLDEADSSGNDLLNWQAYVADLDPTNSDSVFPPLTMEVLPEHLRFGINPTSDQRQYHIDYTTDLVDPSWMPVTNSIGTGGEWTHDEPMPEESMYFRSRVTVPDDE